MSSVLKKVAKYISYGLRHKTPPCAHNNNMLTVFTRAIIIYVFLLIAMRLMGKKQLGELQPFEFAITLIVAELACIPMSDTQVPVLYGLVPIFTLFIIEFVFTKAVKHSIRIRKLVNGKPVIVMTPQGIDYKAISRLDMTISDLMEALRGNGCFSPSEVQYAIAETNGDISVVQKGGDGSPRTVLPYTLVCEGKTMSENLEKAGFSQDGLTAFLSGKALKPKDVLLLTAEKDGEYYLQPIKGACETGNSKEIRCTK